MNVESNHLNLDRHAYIWSNNGRVVKSGEIFGYREIPGRELGQEIWMNNAGTSERPDWLFMVLKNNHELCCNRHFHTAQDAYAAACHWLASPMRLTLRQFTRGYNDEAITVDGLPSNVEVTIEEVGPDDWRFRIVENDL